MPTTWTLQVNGEARVVPPLGNVLELLSHLGIAGDRIAVELNRSIVRRAEWETTPVRDRDKVEIVQFVGGG